MLTKLMGALDLLSGFLIVFGPTIPELFLYPAGMYLAAKGAFFVVISKDFVSGIDFLIGLYALAIVYTGFYHLLISIISLVFLAQKSAFAFA